MCHMLISLHGLSLVLVGLEFHSPTIPSYLSFAAVGLLYKGLKVYRQKTINSFNKYKTNCKSVTPSSYLKKPNPKCTAA